MVAVLAVQDAQGPVCIFSIVTSAATASSLGPAAIVGAPVCVAGNVTVGCPDLTYDVPDAASPIPAGSIAFGQIG